MFGCLKFETSITSEKKKETTVIQAGHKYTHSIKLHHYGTWPLEYNVHSALRKADQCFFNGGNIDWSFVQAMEPDDKAELSESLACSKLVRSTESINIKIECNSGHKDRQILDFSVRP